MNAPATSPKAMAIAIGQATATTMTAPIQMLSLPRVYLSAHEKKNSVTQPRKNEAT
jgi:hypothetical protein